MLSHSVVSDSLRPHGLYSPWNFPGQNTGVGSLSFLQGIFPIQGSNPGLPHYGQILYQLSHQGSPRILEWVVYPFSRDLPNLGIELGSLALQADSLPAELQKSPRVYLSELKNVDYPNREKLFLMGIKRGKGWEGRTFFPFHPIFPS